MARKPEVLAEAPPLPDRPVDFNAFHDAIAAGKSADEAIAAAIQFPVELAAPEPDLPVELDAGE